MKRNFKKDTHFILITILMSMFFTSCSSLFTRRNENNNLAAEENQQNKFVPREQYDEIVRKYQELLSQSKSKPVEAIQNEEVKKDNLEGMRPENIATTAIDPGEIVNKIDQAVPDSKLETPSEAVQKEIAKSGPPIPETIGVEHVNSTDDIDEQIAKMREATELIKVNKFENALVILKDLENSKEKQVVVRAKMMLGDLLFNQGEYDLAMQVYEEVIKKFAFSGHVLKALGKLVVCSEKLKQPEKQAKYYSLLHDFFEAA